MSKITLSNVGSIPENPTSAATTINTNNATIQTAFDNTLSRDGTSPNQMGSNLDLDSNRILNLPLPLSSTEPLRLADANTLNGGGTIQSIPAGGTTGQVLAKNSGVDYDATWKSESTELTAGTNIIITGTTPATIATTTTPSFSGVTISGLTASSAVASDGSKNLVSVTNTGTGNNVLSTSPTLVTPVLGTPSSGTLTSCTGLPVSTGISGLAAGVATFLATPSSANFATALTGETGSGAVVFGTSPTIVTPLIAGVIDASNAAAGNYGEYIESVIASGSAVALTTSTAKTVTSISLTAGDWDVDIVGYILPAATTTTTQNLVSLSLVTNTLDITTGRFFNYSTSSTTFTAAAEITGIIPPYRINVSSTTSVFLVVRSTFAVSTCSAYGIIRARRVR